MDGSPKGKPYYQRKRGRGSGCRWPVGRAVDIGPDKWWVAARCGSAKSRDASQFDGPERAAGTLRARPLPHPCPVASISCEPDVVGAAQSAKRAGTQSGDGRCAAGRHHAQGGGSHAERGVPNEFNAAISQVANVGFTFGGAFAGHGVYVTGGNARFILKQYSVSQ
jgi:hypothetical protein